MATMSYEQEKAYIEGKLHEKDLKHLKVTKRGDSLVVYSEDSNGKENRCRFTYKKRGIYNLSMSNHTGRWEATPFEESLEELLEMVIEQFPWTLIDYEQDNVIPKTPK